MKKYIVLTKNSFTRNLVYRFRMMVWFFVNLLLIFIFPFVWLAAYGDQETIVNFDKTSLITYFIVLAIVNTIVVTHLEERVNIEIKDGYITKFLVKPLPYISEKLFGAITYRLTTILVPAPLIIAAIFIFKEHIFIPENLLIFIPFLLSIILAFFISALSTYFMGLFAFWLDDASSLQGFYWISFALFSGQFAPLDFLPQILQKIAALLPFKYMIYFPVNVYLQKIDAPEITQGLLIQLAWICLFGIFSYILWKRGLKKYTAVGL